MSSPRRTAASAWAAAPDPLKSTAWWAPPASARTLPGAGARGLVSAPHCRGPAEAGAGAWCLPRLPSLPQVESPEAAPQVPDTLKPHILFLHGKPFVAYAGLLQVAHERGLVSLTTKIEHHSAALVLASATATFADGRSFTEWADATPGNVKAHVRPHSPDGPDASQSQSVAGCAEYWRDSARRIRGGGVMAHDWPLS